MPRTTAQAHLERRGALYYWRRRWPKRPPHIQNENFFRKGFLLFPLRTDVLRNAKVVARRLSGFTDLAFAACAEKTMAIPAQDMDTLVTALCRFQIEAADLARELAPTRSFEAATYEESCADAALATLRQAIFLRDREIARRPLRAAAERLGVDLDEADEDYPRLALRALEAMVEAGEENMRRDHGRTAGSQRYLHAALAGTRQAPPAVALAPAQGVPPEHGRPAIDLVAGMSALGLGATPQAPVCTSKRTHEPDAGSRPAERAAKAQPRDTARAQSCATREKNTSHQPARQRATGPAICDVADEYIEARCQGYRSFRRNEQAHAAAGASWAKNSSGNVKSTTKLLTKALPVSRLGDVTDEMMSAAWSLIQRLPRSYGDKPGERRSLQDIAHEADAMDAHNENLTRNRLEKQGASPGKIEYHVNIGRVPRVRAATVYRHMQDFQRICKFAVAKGFLDSNIMEEHIWEKREYERRELLQEDNKREVWFDDLPRLFRTPVFQEDLEEKGDPLFWAPLISVHSGMRSEEVLQLATADIRDVAGIPCFVLSCGAGQSLKSLAARRTIPVHQNLIDLGLLELVALREHDGEPRLFPWLERSKAKKTFTEIFSKRFKDYRKRQKVYKENMDFHALRTTFNQGLVHTSCSDTSRRYLMGHVEHDVGITSYTPDGFAISDLLERVNAIEIDISMIRHPFHTGAAAEVTQLDAHRRTQRSA
ncbi:hypothetical protein [Roseovarius sp. SYSU LYC5161]|uniref:hypothetical protein n=1 Tax=Roseovarius halophilus (ex Wu et al. 2025) TaxID=3376060 RepID=UPI00399C3F57